MASMGIEITGSTFYQMEKRKGKPWRGEIRYRTPDGKLHRATKVFSTDDVRSKTAAKKALGDFRDELIEKLKSEAQAASKAKTLTVWEAVDQYIESSLEQGYIEASTATDYRYTAKRIRATLPDRPLDELTPELLNKWQSELGQTHAHSTLKKTRNVLRTALQDAIDNGRTTLKANPVITKRRTIAQKRIARATAPKLNALDEENRSILLGELDNMADNPVTIAARLAIYAGLREAEISALLWDDIDLDGGFITVNKAIGKADTGLYVKPQKNDDTERDIPIDSDLLPALRRWYDIQNATANALHIDLNETFVIGDPSVIPPSECFSYLEGNSRDTEDEKLLGNAVYPIGIYQPARLSREWRTHARSSKALGMRGKPVTFHNLRHSYGFYNANVGGVDLDELAKWMGHGDTATTKKYYVAKDKEAARASSRQAMEDMKKRVAARASKAAMNDTTD